MSRPCPPTADGHAGGGAGAPPDPTTWAQPSASSTRTGLLYGLAAYGAWGLFPLYFKLIEHVPPWQIVAHRIIWSVALLAILLCVRRQWADVRHALRSARTMAALAATTVLIGGNWFVFIWAVANDHVLQSSLGYFINPLVTVALGFVFLRERLRRWQWASVGLALVGVAIQAREGLPWVALVLAFSFAMYGLLRKTAAVSAIVGLTVETTLLLPWAVGYVVWVGLQGRGYFWLPGVEVAVSTVTKATADVAGSMGAGAGGSLADVAGSMGAGGGRFAG